MSRSAIAWAATLALSVGCGGEEIPEANGRLAGRVVAATPVAQATVTVWEIGDDGTAGDAPLATTTTEEDGTFTAEIGSGRGVLRLEVSGGTTRELWSDPYALDMAETALSTTLTGFEADEERTGIMVTPLTTMATALGQARAAGSSNYPAENDRAHELLGTHFGGFDLRATSLVDVTDPQVAGTPLTDEVRYGLALAVASGLAETVAQTSSLTETSVNTIAVTAGLAADAGSTGALFDGEGPGGAVSVGECPLPEMCDTEPCRTICDLGPATLRALWASELEAFIGAGQNATGLELRDIQPLAQSIRTNDEPELFGDAGTDATAPAITLTQEFFPDPETGIWWTRDGAPTIAGKATDASAVTVSLEVNGERIGETVADAGRWAFSLEEGVLAPAPVSNMIRIAAVDETGNRSFKDLELRLDDTAPSLEPIETRIADERDDQIDFAGAGGAEPSHTHAEPSVSLTAGGCPDVYKHAYLLDGQDNPLAWRFRVSDDGVGPDDGAGEYRVVRGGSALTEWTGIPAEKVGQGGVTFRVSLTRAAIPELGTKAGEYSIELRGADFLGQKTAVESFCWTHHPLAAPIAIDGEGTLLTGTLDLVGLGLDDNDPISEVLNGTGEAGIMEFELRNGTQEDVHVTLSPNPPSGQYTKEWRIAAVEVARRTVSFDCDRSPGECESPPLPNVDGQAGDTIPASFGARVTVREDGIPLAPCDGCPPNRFRLPAAPSGEARIFTVRIDATDTPFLQPRDPGAGEVSSREVNLVFDGNTSPIEITGTLFEIVTRCTDTVTDLNNCPPAPCTVETTCVEQTDYRKYRAVERIDLDVGDFVVDVELGVTAGARPHAPVSGPAASDTSNFTWATFEDLPAPVFP